MIWSILISIAVVCAVVCCAIMIKAYREGMADFDDRMNDIYGGKHKYKYPKK